MEEIIEVITHAERGQGDGSLVPLLIIENY